MTLNLPGKPYLALSGIILNPVEFDIRVKPVSGKKVYPVYPYGYQDNIPPDNSPLGQYPPGQYEIKVRV